MIKTLGSKKLLISNNKSSKVITILTKPRLLMEILIML